MPPHILHGPQSEVCVEVPEHSVHDNNEPVHSLGGTVQVGVGTVKFFGIDVRVEFVPVAVVVRPSVPPTIRGCPSHAVVTEAVMLWYVYVEMNVVHSPA